MVEDYPWGSGIAFRGYGKRFWKSRKKSIPDDSQPKRLFINWIGEEGPIEGDAKILCSICSMDDDDECSCWICDRCMEKVGDDKVIFGDADQFNEAPYCPACFGILSSLGKDFDDSSAAAGARA